MKRSLILLAWIIEILAALIVLEPSFVIGITVYESFGDEISGFRAMSEIILALLPFLLVSLLTLSRIPLIKSYRRVQGRTMKVLKTLVLIVISLMIFETIAGVFEREFALSDLSSLEIIYILSLAALLALLGPVIAYLSIYKVKGKN